MATTLSTTAGLGVVFNEIMYHPATNEVASEWIELHNRFSYDVDVSLWSIRGEVRHDFPNATIIPAHGHIVVGPFENRLSNAGGELRLRNNSRRLMDVVDYRDGGRWPVAPDGSGASLCKRNPKAASEDAINWSWSRDLGGTPGQSNRCAAPYPLSINEVTAGTGTNFWIELANNGAAPLPLTNHTLRVQGSVVGHYTFTTQTVPPHGYAVVTTSMLGVTPADGDKIFLFASNAVADAVIVDDRLRGRTPDNRWLYPETATPFAANSYTFETNIVINEIMYRPAPQLDPYAESNATWLELHNHGTNTVDISEWRLEDAVDFAFPPGSSIAPDNYLVVADSTNVVLAIYPGLTNLIGSFSRNLSYGNDRIVLTDAFGNPADVVEYYDSKPWPYAADGYGPSLELRDPRADNSAPEAWTASDEGSPATWQICTYTSAASPSTIGPDGQWQEFVLGLLQAGEILLDDISLIEDPEGSATELLQNGGFEDDTIGTPPTRWRIIGNHRHSTVVVDPAAPGNKVLRLTASGPTEHLHNHAETTLAGGATIRDGTTYRISFRAKWLTGSRQLNTRLYFNRCARTTALAIPPACGTPGKSNSVYASNIGPTFAELNHAPPVPSPGEDVTVSICAADPDGVGALTNWYAVNEGTWTSLVMTHDGGLYTATIPGQAARDVVQFYVSGSDKKGAVAACPPAGPESRVLYRVDDGHAATNGMNSVRIIMLDSDYDFMLTEIERMSNERLGGTVILDEREIFYDVGVRLKGSGYGRNDLDRAEFLLRFNAGRLFYGSHRDVAVDRSQSGFVGQREMLANIFMNRAGGTFSRYSDLVKCIAPRDLQTSAAELRPDRLDEPFLDTAFDEGNGGSLYEYELVYYPLTTVDGDPESRKKRASKVVGTPIENMGDSREDYRWTYLLKNNRMRDDFERLMEVTRVYDRTNAAFHADIGDYLDVDQWMRTFALAIADGHGDSFASGHLPHNAFVYLRPSDNRLLYFPHDMDHAWRQEEALVPNNDLHRFIEEPAFERLYYGHMLDVLQTAYNATYMAHWTTQLGALLPDQGFASYLDFIRNRSTFLHQELAKQITPAAPFQVSVPTSADTDHVTVYGDAWIDVHEIRVDGLPGPLATRWTATGEGTARTFGWTANLPVLPGTNSLTFRAYDFQGNEIATHTRTVISTGGGLALQRDLRVTELMVNPREGSGLEFIEFHNAGTQALDLAEVTIADGITFAFAGSGVTSLPPGEYAVVTKDLAEFAARHDTNGMLIAGQFTGKLANEGERVRVQGPLNAVIVAFTYAATRAWPVAADGSGHSLVPRTYARQDDGYLDQPVAWRASAFIGGSPGRADPAVEKSIVINEFAAHTDYSGAEPWRDSNDWIELFGAAATSVTFDTHWYLSDDRNDLEKWQLPTGTLGAGHWTVFTEVDHFHPSATSGFGLNKSGEEVLLSYLPGTDGDRVVDAIQFQGQQSDMTQGRDPDGGDAWFALSPTINAANTPPASHLVIDEVMYHPLPDTNVLEYIEVWNPTGGTVPLWTQQALPWDASWQQAWRVSGGIAYAFPSNTTLSAGQRIVLVAFDPADTNRMNAFLTHYRTPTAGERLFGPYDGRLSNGGERLTLEKPEAPDLQGDPTVWVTIDEVVYGDRAPWPGQADGTGLALQRAAPSGNGSDPASWDAGLEPTPSTSAASATLQSPPHGSAWIAPCVIPLRATIDSRFTTGSVQAAFAEGSNTIAIVSNAPYEVGYACPAAVGADRNLYVVLTDAAGQHRSRFNTISVYTNFPTVTLRNGISVNGNLYDEGTLTAQLDLNGLPSELVHARWRQTGGPTAVFLSDPDAFQTSVRFDQSGIYELELVATYGQRALTNTVSVTVLAENSANTVPYIESFEQYTMDHRIDGIAGWQPDSFGLAMIADGSKRSDNAVPILNDGHDRAVRVEGTLDNRLTGLDMETNVWVDALTECRFRNRPWETAEGTDYQFAFYFASNGHMCVWHSTGHSNRWAELPDVTVTNGQWARVTVQTDQTDPANRFRVWFDGSPVTNPSAWFTAAGERGTPLKAIRVKGQYRIDDLVVENYDTLNYRKLTTEAGPNGTIAPAGETLVPIAANTNVTATASNYYHVSAVAVDDRPLSTGGSNSVTHAFTNVIARHSVSAAFAENLAAHATPEWWLAGHGWTNDFDTFAMLDTDGDGLAAWMEYAAGTVPTNGRSALVVTGIRRTPGGVELTWPSASNRLYSVHRLTNGLLGPVHAVTDALLPHSSGTNTFVDPFAGGNAFYRIRVTHP